MRLRFRAGIDGQQAADTIRQIGMAAGNARNGDLYSNYLKWAEEAERMLSNVLEVEQVSELVHTARFWSLRTVMGPVNRLPALVDAELSDRQQVLELAAKDILAARARWRARAATLTVVDTNIFLDRERPIETIDWLTVMDTRPGVRLVVPLIVIHELDRLKRQGNSTTAKATHVAIRWLAKTLPSNPNGWSDLLAGTHERGVTVEVVATEGPSRPEDADWEIIQFARELQVTSGMRTRLVTRDLAMQLRAQVVGVDALLLSNELLNGTDEVLRQG